MEQVGVSAGSGAGRLRRRLWWERAVFAVVLGAGLAYYYLIIRGVGGACLITLDGRPTVVVRSQAVANRVLAEIKQGAGKVEGASFLQQVALRHVSAEGNRLVSDVEAMRVLSPRLTVVVSGAGVFANDRLVFGLPNRREAVSALSRLLAEFSPRDPELARAFRERVRVSETQIPVSLLVPSADAVVDKVREMTPPRGTHLVQRGETAWKIAAQYHVSLEMLARANPGVDLKLLHEEDRLSLPGGGPPLTVIAWKEVVEPITTGSLAGKSQTVRLVYENGVKVETTVVRRPHREEPSRPESRRKPRRRSRPTAGRQRAPKAVQEGAPPPQENTQEGAPTPEARAPEPREETTSP